MTGQEPQEGAAGLADRLYELLHHFEPSGADYFGKDDLKVVVEELLRDAAVQAWTEQQMAEMKIKSMEFRNGVEMDLEPAQEMAATWVAAARKLLMGAPNYTETPFVEPPHDPNKASYSMTVSIPELPDRYTLTVQRVAAGTLTPHEGRMRAEDAVEKVWQWIADANNGLGYDTGDLASMLEGSGFPPPPESD